jgi:hypothetical protein
MRTTLTLDDDIAEQIKRLRRERDASLKAIINEVLRAGLRSMSAPLPRRKPFRTEPITGVTPLLSNFDNVAEVISIAEGEMHK